MAGAEANIVIGDGEVRDGSGAPPVPADVVVTGGRIVAITPRYEVPSRPSRFSETGRTAPAHALARHSGGAT